MWLIMILWLLLAVVLACIIRLEIRQRTGRSHYKDSSESNPYPNLLLQVIRHTDEYLQTEAKRLSKKKKCSIETVMTHQQKLQQALRRCSQGDQEAKELVCQFIYDTLVEEFDVEEWSCDQSFPFQSMDQITDREFFELLLFRYIHLYQDSGMEKLIEDLQARQGGSFGVISKNQVRELFKEQIGFQQSIKERLAYLVQRIYEDYVGMGQIDLMLDQKLDGISAGVNGDFKNDQAMPCVWIMFRGNILCIRSLHFSSESELKRICRNVCQYHGRGQLSEVSGYLITQRMDGARVVVSRPPFAESWNFFLRKYNSVSIKKIQALFPDTGYKVLELLCRCLIRGECTIGITGAQGTGKTTMLSALIDFIPSEYTLRVLEMSYELNLRKQYPNRNILTLCETDLIPGQEALDLMKKTDGMVSILGEVATAPVASYMIQLGSVASHFTLFTHHAKTSEGLIMSLRNALLLNGGFQNEEIAQMQVLSVLDFDIHLKNQNGKRYVEKINEYIWDEKTAGYQINTLLQFKDDHYEYVNPIGLRHRSRIYEKLSKEDRLLYLKEYEACFKSEDFLNEEE